MLKAKLLICIIVPLAIFGPAVYAQEDVPSIKKGQLLPAPKIYRSSRTELLTTPSLLNAVFEEDFETGGSTWSTTGVWQIGSPTSGPNSGHESFNCAATNLSGDYPNYADDWLISPTLNLPELTYPSSQLKLYFWEWFEIESGYDHGKVKISTDGGSTWTELGDRSGSSGWQETMINLTSYAGESIKLAFQLTSDGSVTYSGWYVDDIRIFLEEPDPLEVTLVSLNPQNFPFIYMNVAVSSFGEGVADLTQSNFEVYENGTLQTDYFEVTPPETGAGSRLADIIFLMDNSGSMGDEINAVSNNVYDFVDNLAASGVDFALGLCRFGSSENSGYPIIEDTGNLTQDVNYFKNDVWGRNVTSGGFEPGWDALYESVTSFNFRPGAQKVFILITDETPTDNGNVGNYTQQEAISTLQSNSVTTFALIDLSDAHAVSDYGIIAEQTNGEYFDIYTPFDDIFDYIVSGVANTYLIRYRSSDPNFNGVLRNVQVVVSYQGYQDTAEGSYAPGSAPHIQRTQSTLNLHNQSWAAGTEFTIEAEITDSVAPYVQSATLYYKNTSEPTYRSTAMTNTSGDLWEGIIPGGDVQTPGLDYYLTATDGQSTVSDPSVNPGDNPYQIAILPNEAPQITHTPITTATAGTVIPITVEVVDTTNWLSFVRLFYRKTGQLLYQAVEMTNTSGNVYQAEIPPDYVTVDGVDYYIFAQDDLGVGNYHGTPDNPHLVTVLSQNDPPICAIELRKHGTTSPINEIGIGNPIGIYVGASTDDTGITKVRFSSDDLQDGVPSGEWTAWYEWNSSSGDWNHLNKTMTWSFATSGNKEVWAEVEDDIGQTNACSADVYVSLLLTYAPVLYLHPDEQFYPWGIESMLDKAELWHTFYHVNPSIIENIPVAIEELVDPSLSGETIYLDLKKSSLEDYDRYGPGKPTKEVWEGDYEYYVYGRYYEPKPPYDDKIVLQYWFFYPFNDWKNNHEGDWEMAQIILDKTTENPTTLTCGFHHDGRKSYWDSVKNQNIENTHPKIFIAKGSHGCWATSGTHRPPSSIFIKDETSEEGLALYPQNVNPISIQGVQGKEAYTLIPISDEVSWVTWKGKWGDTYPWAPGSNGPDSPAEIDYTDYPSEDFLRWQEPVQWGLNKRTHKWSSHVVARLVTKTKSAVLHVFDYVGRHVGWGQSIEAQIPGTYFYVPSSWSDDGNEYVWIYTDDNLRFEIHGQSTSSSVAKAIEKSLNRSSTQINSTGTFDFAFSKYLEDQDQGVAVTYDGVSFAENTIAIVDVSPENPEYLMENDIDGDGTVDETVSPNTIDKGVIVASIAFPSNNSIIGGEVAITGIAAGDDFQQYKVEYGEGEAPASWIEIASSTTPVSSGNLATWDTTSIEDGIYSVRLTVTDPFSESTQVRIKVTTDNTSPKAEITSPSDDELLAGAINVTGTAWDEHFKQYKVKYGEVASPTSWVTIATSTTPVTNNTLATWDTTSVDDGDYILKVWTEDQVGNTSEDTVGVEVDNTLPTAEISYPSDGDVLSEATVIVGTAWDKNFDQYIIEYGQGTSPVSWTTITTSTTPLSDEILATWDTTAVDDGIYTLKLRASDKVDNTNEDQVTIGIDDTYPETFLTDYPPSQVVGNVPKVDVSFSWTGSDNLTETQDLIYQWKLEGYENDGWSDWASDTSTSYKLPSGDYTFKVRAKDEGGNFPPEDDPATAKYSFTVSLPIIVYPNPCYPNKGQVVTIANLPLNSKVYIYTISGELVRVLDDATEITTEGGSATATWDLRNEAGNLVAQGVYIYFVPQATDKKTGKIAIIK